MSIWTWIWTRSKWLCIFANFKTDLSIRIASKFATEQFGELSKNKLIEGAASVVDVVDEQLHQWKFGRVGTWISSPLFSTFLESTV
jgi:hypothetical protein